MSVGPADNSSVELGRYLTTLRRRWLTVLLCGAIGAALALGYLALRPPEATATALVNVNVISAEPFNYQREPSGLLDPQTEVQLARSAEVVSGAALAIGDGTRPSEVRGGLRVELIGDATVLRVSYSDEDREDAITGADAVAEGYIAYRSAQAKAKLDAITSQLVGQRNELREALREVNERIAAASPGSPRAIQADSDRQLLNRELDSLLQQVNEVSAIDVTGGTVLTPATDNEVFLSPNRTLLVAGGLILGLLIGLVIAFVREALDRRVHDDVDLARADGGRLLGTTRHVPRASALLEGPGRDDLATIRERLLAAVPGRGGQVAVVDSHTGRPTFVAAGLAETLARRGAAVEMVLVDYPDEYISTLQQDLGLELASGPGGTRLFRSTLVKSLSVAVTPSAELIPNTPDGAFCLFAIPPQAPQSTRLTAVRRAGSVVLVVPSRRARHQEIRRLASEVRGVGARVVGTVLLSRKG